jgi:hypothetical protein
MSWIEKLARSADALIPRADEHSAGVSKSVWL